MKKATWVLIGGIVVLGTLLFVLLGGFKEDKHLVKRDRKPVLISGNFTSDIVKNTYVDGENYLVSPYSLEMALNLLKVGADGNTYQEIEKLVPTRAMPLYSAKHRVSVANAVFIKNEYKNNVLETYLKEVENLYEGEAIYDDFKKPTVINNWVSEKTSGMIDKIVDSFPKDFMMGLANAIAIDVDWASQFDCYSTTKSKFETANGSIDVEMRHDTYSGGVEYVKTDNEIGIILPYRSYNSIGESVPKDEEDSISLEFVAIKPNMSTREYVENMTMEKLTDTIDNAKSVGEKEEIHLALPRFTYDYSIDDLIEVLESFGIKDAFNENANFSRMANSSLYVGEAKHKTHIELNETGTKAAAVTYFGMNATALPVEKKTIEITFDKPFIYLIRDSKNKEILFFGVVNEPNAWKGRTCKES